MNFPITLKFAVFKALGRYSNSYQFRFLERGAVVAPGKVPTVVYWVEDSHFCGDVYDEAARQVGSIRVPIEGGEP